VASLFPPAICRPSMISLMVCLIAALAILVTWGNIRRRRHASAYPLDASFR
jgi:hypothetical protein